MPFVHPWRAGLPFSQRPSRLQQAQASVGAHQGRVPRHLHHLVLPPLLVEQPVGDQPEEGVGQAGGGRVVVVVHVTDDQHREDLTEAYFFYPAKKV